MHWSVESRVPFLTPALARIGLNVPENYLVSQSGDTKHLLRLALNGIIDPAVINRKDKIGFETPQESWVSSLISPTSEVLDSIKDFDFLDPEKSRDFLLKTPSGHSRQNSMRWRLFNLIRWKQLTMHD